MQQSGNPFVEIKRVEVFQELLDVAFNKAIKIKPPGGRMDGLTRSRTHEMNRINTAANVLVDRLERIVKDFPSLNLIHPFYFELAFVLVDLDNVKLALGRISGIIKHIRNVEFELIEQFTKTEIKKENKQIRKTAFGRFSSMLKQLDSHLKTLEEVRLALHPLPGFDPYIPSVVVAGIPNSGKSSFIRLTTSGKPEIASYPFTTKQLIFGHRKFGFLQVQFIDTPGLLDRPLEKRNNIELQALTALKHLSDIMIFLIDVTQGTICTLKEQINLLSEIKEFYPILEVIIVVSKIDLLNDQSISKVKEILVKQNLVDKKNELLTMHSKDQSGVKSLLEQIDRVLKHQVINNSKFKVIMMPEIATDQLPVEDDPIWQNGADEID